CSSDLRGQFYSNVESKFVEIEDELIGSGAVISNHENRITVLESGNTIAEFFSNDVWTKPMIVNDPDPPVAYHRHEFIGIGGGGGGRRPAAHGYVPRGSDNYPGGQGGYGSQSHLNADVGDTVDVVIGTAGAGGASDSTSGTAGGATSFTDIDGNLYTAGGGGPGTNSAAGARGSGTTFTDWDARGGRGFYITGVTTDVQPTAGNAGYLANGGSPGTQAGANGGNGQPCPA